MLTTDEILQFMQEDASSEKKQYAKVGERYYEGEHDIKNYRLFYFNADGELVEDKTRSNIRISHAFFTELVEQKVQYMLSGKEGFIFSDTPELQKELNSYFNENEDFLAELYDLITGTSTKGFDYMYAYKDEDDKTRFKWADSIGVIEVRAKDTNDKCDYVIYWYVDRVEKGQKKIKRIQVWNDKETYYYVQDTEKGTIELDKSETINPRPHILFTKDGDKATYFDDYGMIPFFRLDNNRKQFSDLKTVKELIDDYDIMACGLSNNIQDAQEYFVIVRGFQGDNLDELIQNIKTKKAINVSGEDGGSVDIRTVDIPYQARQTKLGLDEANIYRFGMGFNSTQVGDGNITNVVIKSRYGLLDLKCNKLEIKLKQFLRKLLKLVLNEINEHNDTAYQQSDVYFKFDRELIVNEADNAQIEFTKAQRKQVEINTILGLKGALDDETIIQNVCDILEIDYEDIKGKLPQPAEEEINAAEQELLNLTVDEGQIIS